MTYVNTKDLPPVVRKALAAVGYGRETIEMKPRETFTLQYMADDGARGFNVLINLATEQFDLTWGSWGGPNMFAHANLTDRDDTARPLPDGIIHLQGQAGGRGCFAHLRVNPKTLAPLLPAAPTVDLTEKEHKALRAVATLTSAGRKDEFSREGLGVYGPTNPLIAGLAEKGLVKVGKVGVSITLEGKNLAKGW